MDGTGSVNWKLNRYADILLLIFICMIIQYLTSTN